MSTDIQMVTEVQEFSQDQHNQLDAPLDASLIKQRPDGKKYLKGSTEFDNANRIFGYGKWGYRVVSRTLQKVFDLDDKLTGLYFYVEVELFVTGAMFPFYGDGGQGVKYYTPQGYEDASKGATTDAVKRALRHYGDQFGLCLYDEDSLVDVGDGVLNRVKDVKVNNNAPPQKRIVDAAQPRQIAAPASNGHAEPSKLAEVKAHFLKMYKPDRWEPFKVMVLGLPVEDEGLSDSELARIDGKLTEIRKQKVNAAIKAI